MNLKFKKLWKSISNTIDATFKGELLLRLGFDKFFLHIIWLFVLLLIAVWTNYKIEKTLLAVQRNKAEIETLRIIESQTTCELERLKRINTIEKMLEEEGSVVAIPTKPASIVED